LEIARRQPRRVKVVRADRPIAVIQAEIRNLVDKFLIERGGIRNSKFGVRSKST
jgi:hypothetical protein